MIDHKQYPFVFGEVTVLGPEVFVDLHENVICYKGRNFYALNPNPVEED